MHLNDARRTLQVPADTLNARRMPARALATAKRRKAAVKVE